MDDAGRFIVAWTTTPPGTERIFSREFDTDGDPVGGEIQINTFTLENSSTPSAAMNACGDADRNGRVTASDALIVLRVAVSLPGELVCPAA